MEDDVAKSTETLTRGSSRQIRSHGSDGYVGGGGPGQTCVKGLLQLCREKNHFHKPISWAFIGCKPSQGPYNARSQVGVDNDDAGRISATVAEGHTGFCRPCRCKTARVIDLLTLLQTCSAHFWPRGREPCPRSCSNTFSKSASQSGDGQGLTSRERTACCGCFVVRSSRLISCDSTLKRQTGWRRTFLLE